MGKLAVVDGATIECAAGSARSLLTVTNNQVEIDGHTVAAIQDHISGSNIEPFGTCIFTGGPCTPVTPGLWFPGESSVPLGGMFPVLDEESILGCSIGGIIQVVIPGEVFVEVDSDKLVFKGDYDGPGFWESMIPFYGPMAAAGYASGEGKKGLTALNLGFAAIDAFSLGGAAIIRAGAKVGIRGVALGVRSLFGGISRKSISAAQAAAMAGRVFGRKVAASRWTQQFAGKSPREMFALARQKADQLREAAKRNDGSLQRMRRALSEESGFAKPFPDRKVRSKAVRRPPDIEVETYEQARKIALDLLEERGFKPEIQNPSKFPPETRGKPNGMRMKDRNVGFRVEHDDEMGAHINVFSDGKEKFPHIKFKASEKTVEKIQKRFGKVKE
jgi:hypothetical protein